MSNEKQIGLSIVQYTQDYDETFPPIFGEDNSKWPGCPYCNTWPIMTQSYIKDYNTYFCPDDSLGGKVVAGDPGVTVSYAPNGYFGTDYAFHGVFGYQGTGTGWVAASSTNAGIPRPSDTIMLAERHSDDSVKAGGSAYSTVWDAGFLGYNWLDGWMSFGEVPNGTLPAGAYPNGPNGAVSASHHQLANFLFVDGHVKMMHPTATDPDPVNQPQNNMWDAKRQ
jgi:prepilin-type processing-associated H-X9-DG protein